MRHLFEIALVSSGLLGLAKAAFSFTPSLTTPSLSRPALRVPSSFYKRQSLATFRFLVQKDHEKPNLQLSSSKSSSNNSNNNNNKNKGTLDNPIDQVLAWVTSPMGSITLGVLGLVVLTIGRWILDSSDSNKVPPVVVDVDVVDMGQTTRSNLLAILAVCAVLVNGISALDVEAALAEAVTLQGERLSTTIVSNGAMKWALESILAATPAETVVVMSIKRRDPATRWKIEGAAGIVPTGVKRLEDFQIPSTTPILDRFRSEATQESYLPTLQNLPGKTEFTYLPPNAQAVLLVPFQMSDSTSVLVMASNQAKSLTPRDIAWCQTVAARMTQDTSLSVTSTT